MSMLQEEHLRNLISTDKLSSRDKLLLCMAVDLSAPKSVKEISGLAFKNGFRSVKKLNVSDALAKSNGFAVRLHEGWSLTEDGIRHVQQIAGPLMNSPIPKVASALRTQLPGITDDDTRTFVEEAIACFESRQYRAAVVLSWVGAVSVLHNFVIENALSSFNAEASRRIRNWKPAKTTDDLGLMSEDTFLDILPVISVIGKNVKNELKKALGLRNGCGHPNSLKLAEHKVAAHIEDLILNVFIAI